jgi:hypothetical protein
MYPGVINLEADNAGIQIRSSSTRNAATVTLDGGRVNIPKLGSDVSVFNGQGLVYAFNGSGLSDGSLSARYMGGTGNGIAQVTQDGVPFRTTISGTGNRDIFINASGILIPSPSDDRLKQNVETLDLGLDLISTLAPKKYEFKSEPGVVEYGLMAQELRETLDQLGISRNTNFVTEDHDEERIKDLPDGESGPILGIEYRMLIPVLINAVKELQARIELLESKEGNN